MCEEHQYRDKGLLANAFWRIISIFWYYYFPGCTAGSKDVRVLLTQAGFKTDQMKQVTSARGPANISTALVGAAYKK